MLKNVRRAPALVRDRIELVALAYKASPVLTVAVSLLMFGNRSLNLASTVVTGALIGRVPAAVDQGFDSPPGRRLVAVIVLAAALMLIQEVAGTINGVLYGALLQKIEGHVRARIVGAAAGPAGIAHLEDPAVLDQLSLSTGQALGGATPGGAALAVMSVAGRYLQTLGAVAILTRFSWVLALAVLAIAVLMRSGFRTGLLRGVGVSVAAQPALRKARYVGDLGTLAAFAKEVRIFGLAAWLRNRYLHDATSATRPIWDIRLKVIRRFVWTFSIFAIAIVTAFVPLARSASLGFIDLAALAVFLQAFFQALAISGAHNDEYQLEFGAPPLKAIARLEELTARELPGRGSQSCEGLPRRSIRFESVGFTYPRTETPIFTNLDLEIEAGTSLAIVGVNGAGKTTLVKLLARLYEPHSGRITADGIDLARFDPREWQRRLAVIFQDFTRFDLSVAENVGMRESEGDGHPGLKVAATRSGVLDVVEALPLGWQTPLAKAYTNGADLSGGQWQKVALARALYAVEDGAGVLVLDEPTANLDVRAEVELFDRFLDLTSGLTTILISHRFSTVRRADRIVVLDSGAVTEQGTHAELLSLGGRYAEMFNLQAARFREVESS